jgi:hypothetical protein
MAKGHSCCEEHGHWPFLLMAPSGLTTFNKFHNENFGWPKVILIVKNEAIGHFSFWHSLIMVDIYPNAYSHTCSSSHFSKFSPWMWVNINPQCKIFTKSLNFVVIYLLIHGLGPFVTPLLAVWWSIFDNLWAKNAKKPMWQPNISGFF